MKRENFKNDHSPPTCINFEPSLTGFHCTSRTMWPNYPGREQVEMAFKLRQRMKNLPPYTHVLPKTLNLVISRCCVAEYGEEMCSLNPNCIVL